LPKNALQDKGRGISRIKSIITLNESPPKAGAGSPVTLMLEDDLELLRRALEVCRLVKNSVEITLFAFMEVQIPNLAKMPGILSRNADLLIGEGEGEGQEHIHLDSIANRETSGKVEGSPQGESAQVILLPDFLDLLNREVPFSDWLKPHL
jgi:hypothetical protein